MNFPAPEAGTKQPQTRSQTTHKHTYRNTPLDIFPRHIRLMSALECHVVVSLVF
jgi:hypothetical protein